MTTATEAKERPVQRKRAKKPPFVSEVMWCVVMPAGNPYFPSCSIWRSVSRAAVTKRFCKPWRELKKRGFTNIKVRIVPVK